MNILWSDRTLVCTDAQINKHQICHKQKHKVYNLRYLSIYQISYLTLYKGAWKVCAEIEFENVYYGIKSKLKCRQILYLGWLNHCLEQQHPMLDWWFRPVYSTSDRAPCCCCTWEGWSTWWIPAIHWGGSGVPCSWLLPGPVPDAAVFWGISQQMKIIITLLQNKNKWTWKHGYRGLDFFSQYGFPWIWGDPFLSCLWAGKINFLFLFERHIHRKQET